MTQVLSVKQVNVVLDKQAILQDITFSLNKGEILGLVGPSGCGKTTLLNTLAGFIYQQAGSITLAGMPAIDNENTLAPEKRQIGMIFQDYALFPHLTVQQNIAFGITQMPKDQQQSRVKQLIELLKLEGLADRFPHQLSGGQQQRVAIARAMAPQPKLLLLDEPFSNIDARLRQELMLELRQLLKSLNMTAIFVTHNKDEVFTFADKMAVMGERRIQQFGAPGEICQHPNSFLVADFLQLGSWLPCTIENDILATGLGCFPFPQARCVNADIKGKGQTLTMLVKPQFLSLEVVDKGNMQVVNSSVTEQGFHYFLRSVNETDELSIHQLSVYSDQIMNLGQHVNVYVSPHEFVIFPTQ
ncbi:ABC transporter ATP-binding protein [Thalassotalea euphylliae]|uniref:ABC transporter ATP-binding protein n=1 Tax=Thalassotalea euphylliae TaxID=1655234 RepID=UPI003645A333